jgi:hypothetical protein
MLFDDQLKNGYCYGDIIRQVDEFLIPKSIDFMTALRNGKSDEGMPPTTKVVIERAGNLSRVWAHKPHRE